MSQWLVIYAFSLVCYSAELWGSSVTAVLWWWVQPCHQEVIWSHSFASPFAHVHTGILSSIWHGQGFRSWVAPLGLTVTGGWRGEKPFKHVWVSGRQLPVISWYLHRCLGWDSHVNWWQLRHYTWAVPSFTSLCLEDFAAVLPLEAPGPPPCCAASFTGAPATYCGSIVVLSPCPWGLWQCFVSQLCRKSRVCTYVSCYINLTPVRDLIFITIFCKARVMVCTWLACAGRINFVLKRTCARQADVWPSVTSIWEILWVRNDIAMLEGQGWRMLFCWQCEAGGEMRILFSGLSLRFWSETIRCLWAEIFYFCFSLIMR